MRERELTREDMMTWTRGAGPGTEKKKKKKCINMHVCVCERDRQTNKQMMGGILSGSNNMIQTTRPKKHEQSESHEKFDPDGLASYWSEMGENFTCFEE